MDLSPGIYLIFEIFIGVLVKGRGSCVYIEGTFLIDSQPRLLAIIYLCLYNIKKQIKTLLINVHGIN